MQTRKIPPRAPLLDAADLPEETKQALQEIDASMFQWHRMLQKGELTGRLLARSGLDIEPAVFQGLMAVVRITNGIGRAAPEEPTVGLVAEHMAIDPSRASRICSALIGKGYIRRAAAQDDGRKSVLHLTEAGQAAFTQIWTSKWSSTLALFADWSHDDIASFARLVGRYVDGLSAQGPLARSAPPPPGDAQEN